MHSNIVRVLVVDDYPDMCQLMTAVLAPQFEVVGSAADGAAAVVAAAELQPDVVLMDYQMPAMDGLTATSLIKQLPGAPQVVLFTSDDVADLRAHAPMQPVLTRCCRRAVTSSCCARRCGTLWRARCLPSGSPRSIT